jgi:molecular chaperone GrpE
MSENNSNKEENNNTDSKIKELKEEIENLEADLRETEEEREEYLEGWKRAQADFKNYKQEEKKRRKKTQAWIKSDFFAEMVPILDSFEEALENEDESSSKDGLESIYNQFLSVLKKEGLEEIKPKKGEQFDPKFHEAISAQNTDTQEIVAVLQQGYKFKDKILRPARVKVGDNTNV